MNILFVIDTLYTSNNGTSISAQRYAMELRRRGHRVRAICGDRPKTEQDRQITDGDFCTGIFHFPIFQPMCEKHDFYYANARQEVIEAACLWADVVHVYTPLFLGNAVITHCQKIGKPVTTAFHIQPENITSNFGLAKVRPINDMIYRIFRHFTYSRIGRIHTPSAFIANELRKRGYRARMHVISNGIHDAFLQAGAKKIAARDQQPETLDPQRPIRVLMIGRLSREKRQDVIIRAMQYSRYADRIQLVFAGRGPERERYERMSRGLRHKPEFVYLDREALIRELLRTDLYIHASDMEIEAISCIEAFATGLVPVIANSSNSATPQFALDQRSLFRAGDAKDLAEHIDYWLDRPMERMEAEARYQQAAERYTLSNAVNLFERMLRAEMAKPFVAKHETHHTAPTLSVLTALKRQVVRLYRRIA